MKTLVLIALSLVTFTVSAQNRITRATGRGVTTSALMGGSIANTTAETTIYVDTIKAGQLGMHGRAVFKILCNLTSGLVNPSITFRVKLGSATLAIFNGAAIAVNLTNEPFMIQGEIRNRGAMNNQTIWVKVDQSGVSIPLGVSGNGLKYATWNVDTSVDQILSVSLQYGSALTSTTIYPLFGDTDKF